MIKTKLLADLRYTLARLQEIIDSKEKWADEYNYGFILHVEEFISSLKKYETGKYKREINFITESLDLLMREAPFRWRLTYSLKDVVEFIWQGVSNLEWRVENSVEHANLSKTHINIIKKRINMLEKEINSLLEETP